MDSETNAAPRISEEVTPESTGPPAPLRPSLQWERKSPSHAEHDKVVEILSVCKETHTRDRLRAFATSKDGLIDDEVRRRAWPILLGYQSKVPSPEGLHPSWRDLPRHKDEDQVELDVNRSFIYYPKDESDKQLDRRKRQLSDVIVQVLREHPMLSYFQGFHDIVQVCLLVLGVDRASEAVAHLSLLRIRDFMLPSLSPSLAHLNLLPAILGAADPKLCQHLSTTQPFFALSATLTLYAHDIQEYGDIARLFDFFIAQPAVVSVYFFAVIVQSRRDELFDIPVEEAEMLHSVLSKLPKPLDLEALISKTILLFESYPPEHLPHRAWSRISRFSVLKTTRAGPQNQSLADGEELLSKQALQIRQEEIRKRAMEVAWKYRRPVGRIGLAVAVGVLSFWLGRNSMNGLLGSGFRRVWETIQARF